MRIMTVHGKDVYAFRWESHRTHETRGNLGQLSLLPSAGREMSTSQSAVTLCGWGLKEGMVHFTCG